MVETPQSIPDREGICPLQSFMDAAQGRCGSVHFGVYDYTASYGITAAWQAMGHPACLALRQRGFPEGRLRFHFLTEGIEQRRQVVRFAAEWPVGSSNL